MNVIHTERITINIICLATTEWSKESLIEAWMADPVAACEKAGVTLPESEYFWENALYKCIIVIIFITI